MKKNFVKFLLAGLLVFGVLFFMGCKAEEDGDTDKSIKITGLSYYDGYACEVNIKLRDAPKPVAGGRGTVSGGTLEVELYEDEENRWTGSGTYYVQLNFFDDYDSYNYYVSKNGISFSSEVTTVNFAGFEDFGYNDDGEFLEKSIKIINILGGNDLKCNVVVATNDFSVISAAGSGTVTEGIVEVELYEYKDNENRWTGSGYYFVWMSFDMVGPDKSGNVSKNAIPFFTELIEVDFNDFSKIIP